MKNKTKTSKRKTKSKQESVRKIRFAVVGLGYFAQTAVLPAFKNAKNAKLMALVSDNSKKLQTLGRKYKVDMRGSYDMYETILQSGQIDAVYIVLPNSLHKEYAERAARLGIHVLCEKPLAVTSDDCKQMIETCEIAKVKLMTGYRLHFEKANLKAIDIVKNGKIGDPRFFNSVFSMQVKSGNIRLNRELGGGTLYDIGIYCINAARNIFQAEPLEVMAISGKSTDKRFKEVDEMTSATLKFPGDRLATFTTSFGAADAGHYEVIGTKGSLCVDPAYEFAEGLGHEVTIGKKTTKQFFPKRDQVAPEIEYFSDCILKNRAPEPSGFEGLADVRIIEALYESARTGQAIILKNFTKTLRPSMNQEKHKQPLQRQPELIQSETPHP
jgi:predicted dehydrogenase